MSYENYMFERANNSSDPYSCTGEEGCRCDGCLEIEASLGEDSDAVASQGGLA